jgi:hypothetical protein
MRAKTADTKDITEVAVSHDTTTVISASGIRSITLVPTFQRGYVPNVIDGFRFTLQVTGAIQMPTKIFRYRLVPTQVKATTSEPPTAVELKGAFDGVCSPADLEDFPEDWPAQNARPSWYRLDMVDLIVRSRSIADEAYKAIIYEIERLIDTLNTMDQQDVAATITIGPEVP